MYTPREDRTLLRVDWGVSDARVRELEASDSAARADNATRHGRAHGTGHGGAVKMEERKPHDMPRA